jgi:histidine triad (HIT) family protein
VAGKRTATVVAEDETLMTFLDNAPLAPGHCLIVPKRHVATLPEMGTEELMPLMAEVRRLASVIPGALGVDGCLVACNVVVSQSVPHVHLHVVPRRHRDWLILRLLLRFVPSLRARRHRELATRIRSKLERSEVGR